MNKKIIILTGIIILAAAIVFFLYFYGKYNSQLDSFQISSVLIKEARKPGASFDKSLDIVNTGSSGDNFNINLIGIENIASIDKKSFYIEQQEGSSVSVHFLVPSGFAPGIEVGAIEVSNSKEKKELPVIIEIESQTVRFDSNIAIYSSGAAELGGKINADIRIFDLMPPADSSASSVSVSYFVKSLDGETIISDSEDISVNKQSSLTKSFSLPDNLKEGDYVFGVVLKSENSVGTSSAIFRVAKEKAAMFSGSSIYLIIFVAIIILGFFVLILFSVLSKDEALEELKKQYELELKKQEEYIQRKERENERRLESRIERKLNKKLFSRARRERIKVIEKVHKERISKIKKLKKHKKTDELKKQLNEWKKKGYETSMIEARMKLPDANYIKKKVAEWKKKGYETDVLDGEVK